MLVRVSRVRAGGKLLAHTTVLRVGDELHRGLKPLLGVNLVAGATGSGKTLLSEALWLGVVHALGALLGISEAVRAIIRHYYETAAQKCG